MGFAYTYSVNRTAPLVQDFVSGATALAVGDLVKVDPTTGRVTVATTAGSDIVGSVVAPSDPAGSLATLVIGTSKVRVHIDPLAVYSVPDPNARVAGQKLDIAGATGAMGLAVDSNHDVMVLNDSPVGEPTLVVINATKTWLT